MRPLTMVAFMVMFTFSGAGCSDDSKAESEDQTKVETTEPTPMLTKADSLAAFRFPIRAPENKLVTLKTNYGSMTVELYHDVAPAHADSFVARTTDGFYDSLTFHRVIPKFMIQGGCPKGNGTGNAGYFLDAEFSKLPHQDGTLSMARSSSPNSASCQFFVCLSRQGAQHLDGQYTVFGQLIKGFDVLHEIEKAKLGKGGNASMPESLIIIEHAYLSDAEGEAL